jgi:sugar phosphate isomerase/epimerase
MRVDGIRLAVVAQALSTDPRQAARAARLMGAEGLQFDGVSSGLDLTHLTASGRREFRHVLSSQDQVIASLRGDAGTRGFSVGADVDQAIYRISKLMEAAAGLGTALVCVDLGPLPAAPNLAPPKPKVDPAMAGLILLPQSASAPPTAPEPPTPPPDPAFLSQVNAALDELGRRADRYSCVAAFRSELASLASLKQAVTSVNCPWFGIDLDPVSVARDRWDLDETFSQLGPLIRHVRGRDAIVGAENRTKPAAIGGGNVKWDELLDNLDESNYRGWITVDPLELNDRAVGADAGIHYLKRRFD